MESEVEIRNLGFRFVKRKLIVGKHEMGAIPSVEIEHRIRIEVKGV